MIIFQFYSEIIAISYPFPDHEEKRLQLGGKGKERDKEKKTNLASATT